MKKVGRNTPCHCGSGKKFKNCHGQKSTGGSQGIYLLLGVIVVLAGVVIFSRYSGDPSTSRPNFAPQPGAAPPGKVWSPEHGHWHDAFGTAGGTLAQPPGQTPPGKVWSAEHGHWHDTPGEATTRVQPSPQDEGKPLTQQPPGPAPPGKVWSPEHGHWHDAPPQQ